MSNRVKERLRAAAQAQTGLPSKTERRALGKQAAARRAAARRRKRMLKNAGTVGVGLAVVALIVLSFTVFRSKDAGQTAGSPQGSQTPGASAPAGDAGAKVPADMDAALRTKPVVTKGSGTLSKLGVTALVQGKGAVVKAGDTINVNYLGVSYTTGEEFDSSWKRGEPISFPIGNGSVIKGWDQGLVGVKVGSRIQLDIPADLAYGDVSSNGSPSGPLRFVVDVLSATAPTASATP